LRPPEAARNFCNTRNTLARFRGGSCIPYAGQFAYTKALSQEQYEPTQAGPRGPNREQKRATRSLAASDRASQ
jgi:hypothetical protein